MKTIGLFVYWDRQIVETNKDGQLKNDHIAAISNFIHLPFYCGGCMFTDVPKVLAQLSA